jgi:hypothetical protein
VNEKIVFNCWKHHLNFVLEQISATRDNSNHSGLFHNALSELAAIGNNTFDLYTGSLTVESIHEQIHLYLTQNSLTTPEQYNTWLGPVGYKEIKLSDQSGWVLRFGTQTNKYVHVHPSRSGRFTKRFKGSSWKIALLFLLQNRNTNDINLSQINSIRLSLGLSPVKKITPQSDVQHVLSFILLNH